MYNPQSLPMSTISRLIVWIVFLTFSILILQRCQPASPLDITATATSVVRPLLVDTSLLDSIIYLRKNEKTEVLNDLILMLKGQKKEHDPTLAFAIYQRGIIEYFAYNYRGASQYYQDALWRYEKNNAPSDFSTICRLYRNLSSCFYYGGESFDSTYYYINNGIRKVEQYPDSLLEDKTLIGLYQWAGFVNNKLGDLASASDFLRMGVDLCKQGRGDYKICGPTFMSYAWTLMDQNKLDSALFYSEQAEDKMLSYSNKFNYHDSTYLSDIYNNRFEIYTKRNEHQKALDVQKKSLAINQKIRPKSRYVAINYNNIGYIYRHEGKPNLARKYLHKSLKINKTDSAFLYMAKNLEILADVAIYEGKDVQALQYLEEALSYFFPNPHHLPIIAASNKSELSLPMSQRARTLYRLHQKQPKVYPLSDVLIAYEQVDSLVSALQYTVRSEESKVLVIENLKPVYEELIGICESKWQTTNDQAFLNKAFKYLERTKALVLRERQHKGQFIKQSIGKKYQERERQLIGNLSHLRGELQNGDNTKERSFQLLNQIQRLQLGLKHYHDSLFHHSKPYENYLSKAEDEISKEIQQSLDKDKIVLDYFVGEHSVFVGTMTAQGMDIQQLAVSPMVLAEQIQQLVAGLDRSGTSMGLKAEERIQLDEQYRATAFWLYQQLIEPLQIDPRYTSLTIIPDGVLSFLPFAALLTEEENIPEDYGAYAYLIKEKRINQQFSLAIWYDNLGREYPVRKDMLAIAPSQSGNRSISSLGKSSLKFSSLRYNEDEVGFLSKRYGAKVLQGEDASRKGVEQLISDYQVIHFAGHAYADINDPYQSFLVFDVEHTEREREELLSLEELEQLELKANLVVLSACQTADGDLAKGEGVISLSRAATLAGAKSVISSLWLINQQSKVELFHRFYAHIADGLPKDEALQRAQLEYIQQENNNRHPYHWAGVVNMGNTEPISLSKSSVWSKMLSKN